MATKRKPTLERLENRELMTADLMGSGELVITASRYGSLTEVWAENGTVKVREGTMGSNHLPPTATFSESDVTKIRFTGSGRFDWFDASGVSIPVEADGNGGNDRIIGGRGNDLLIGGSGVDEVKGGPGNDRIYGDEIGSPMGNRDYLFGEAGNDHIEGGGGDDHIWGGSGRDTLYGGLSVARHLYYYGYFGSGNDRIYGGSGTDVLVGQDGDDLLDGGWGTDYLYGDLVSPPQNYVGGVDTFIQYYSASGRAEDHIMDYRGNEGDRVVLGKRLPNTFRLIGSADMYSENGPPIVIK